MRVPIYGAPYICSLKKKSTVIRSLHIIKKGMKIYTRLNIIFAFVILFGLIPISEGFYRPTHNFLKNTVRAILEKQLEMQFEKSGNAAPWCLCYWRWKIFCIGALPKTYPVNTSPDKTYELLFEMF